MGLDIMSTGITACQLAVLIKVTLGLKPLNSLPHIPLCFLLGFLNCSFCLWLYLLHLSCSIHTAAGCREYVGRTGRRKKTVRVEQKRTKRMWQDVS